MESILWRIKDTAQQYVDILEQVLGIDASILDDEPRRVAGSGRMRDRVGNQAHYGNVMQHAIETRATVIVEDPIENPLCRDCVSRDICDNLCELWTPILLEGNAVGVIGCVCYDQEQKARFLAQRDMFEQFFTQFAGLLSSQLQVILQTDRSENVQEMLEHMLGRVQIGLLILDSQDRVYDLNQAAQDLLNLDSMARTQCSIRPMGQAADKEYELRWDGSVRRIVADIYQVGLDPYDRLVVFGDAQLRSEVSDGLLQLAPSTALDRIIGQSAPIVRLKKNIRLVAPSTSNVLITGESGTGKELAARAVHGESLRKDGPFVAVNCAALPENLLESELFGYVKGAFTGANANGKKGLLETAQGGTFFLDEVGDMPAAIQVKLLRVLEQRELTRLGSNIPIPIDVRFVFATNRDLEKMVQEGTFRQDLYYRINVVPLTLPPLRERPGDIRLIAGGFIRKFTSAMQRPCSGVGEDFWMALEQYDWPGNVRELQNVIEYAVNMLPSSGVLRSELLRKRLGPNPAQGEAPRVELGEDWSLRHMEEVMIRRCLEKYKDYRDGKRMAARQLGISIATLYRKMKEYGL